MGINMKAVLITIIAILSISSIFADLSFGRCKTPKYELDKFVAERYMGNWYEIFRSKSIPFERGDCNKARYTLNGDGSINISNSEVRNGKTMIAHGKAQTVKDNPFHFKVGFTDYFVEKFFKGDYQVIDTDYHNWAVVYSCTSMVIGKLEYYWLLSRKPNMSGEEIEKHMTYYKNVLKVILVNSDLPHITKKFAKSKSELPCTNLAYFNSNFM